MIDEYASKSDKNKYNGSPYIVVNEYDNFLQFNFSLSLPSVVYTYAAYCYPISVKLLNKQSYIYVSFKEKNQNSFLSDLEIVFSPSNQYIGNDYVGFGVDRLYSWPSKFDTSSTVNPVSTGNIKVNLKDFDRICFLNNCFQSNDCSNQFTGFINIYGISSYSYSSDTNSSLSLSASGIIAIGVVLGLALMIVCCFISIFSNCKNMRVNRIYPGTIETSEPRMIPINEIQTTFEFELPQTTAYTLPLPIATATVLSYSQVGSNNDDTTTNTSLS
uniref:Uncharacterized protein n=1 Tax=Chromulina nebulosa TaxID=96789 RepID=A0A7S0XBD0_9STRA|mmetsp:Transcript_1749/g.1558  ORF Transcript_1749/g.1558 Transcript_1749/m.1558 type:complete len:273 (+) Transcript_1749:42-860(+)